MEEVLRHLVRAQTAPTRPPTHRYLRYLIRRSQWYSVSRKMTQLFDLFTLLPAPIFGAIAVVMYRRKQHRLYFVFWIYFCFQFTRVIVVNIVSPHISLAAYFYAYWTASLCSVFFTLLLLRSIFVTVLSNFPDLARTRRIGYELALGIMWSAALLIAFRQAGPHTITDMISRAEQAISFTAVGMLIFVVLSSMFLGIRWNAAICGMAGGLGLLGTVDLLVFTFFWRREPTYSAHVHLVGWIQTLTFNIAVAIFAFYFLPVRAEIRAPEDMKPELVEWAESMKGVISK